MSPDDEDTESYEAGPIWVWSRTFARRFCCAPAQNTPDLCFLKGKIHRETAHIESFDSGNRIKAYLGLSGAQVCMAGLGSGANFGTFSRKWKAGDLMNGVHWVNVLKCPSENEKVTRGVHYEPIEPPGWRPKTVILNRKGEDPLITVKGDRLGGRKDRAEFITVLSSATTAIAVQGEPAECPSLEDVQTPASPPMIASP